MRQCAILRGNLSCCMECAICPVIIFFQLCLPSYNVHETSRVGVYHILYVLF